MAEDLRVGDFVVARTELSSLTGKRIPRGAVGEIAEKRYGKWLTHFRIDEWPYVGGRDCIDAEIQRITSVPTL